MIWTKEQRYRHIEEVSQKELLKLRLKVSDCNWRQTFHIQPETGLLNDPNGFSYYNGEYHLFYQWFPLGPVHGLKYWYHTKSKDLVHWENVGIGIEPTDDYDSHGAYSGSAIEHDGKLYLLYTGNTRDKDWERHPYQRLAIMDKAGEIVKLEQPVIRDVPNGYTDHFRDPKIWKEGNKFYAVIGAQRENKTGCVVLYSSTDLLNWKFEGELKTNLINFGYMWECPDYFELQDQGVLIFSPQGLEPKEDHFKNIYQSGYILGDKLDLEKLTLTHAPFQELDRGFDFYAPQTMMEADGRRILVGWMGMPEIDYPTDKNGWAHCLTLPRELSIRKSKLIQQPVKELQALRKQQHEIKEVIH
ncbi:beta-fructofuranosidase [Neobacillus ginsengisoli]|uniref:Sucrose-6-phosphate hydrolase n=1 Tax=Neobacillus ginsengisoli TaxID=904295 RepID=A0ABT9XRU3_9BACI|nr:beta-fructofuranosidase [Neobacillus ginsengisoli]